MMTMMMMMTTRMICRWGTGSWKHLSCSNKQRRGSRQHLGSRSHRRGCYWNSRNLIVKMICRLRTCSREHLSGSNNERHGSRQHLHSRSSSLSSRSSGDGPAQSPGGSRRRPRPPCAAVNAAPVSTTHIFLVVTSAHMKHLALDAGE